MLGSREDKSEKEEVVKTSYTPEANSVYQTK